MHCYRGGRAGPLILAAHLILASVTGARGEIDVSIKVPIAVAENSTVKLTCDYDLHSLALYSVKWYKSQDEFYRFIPKEMPSKTAFPPLADKVDIHQSDDHNVILNNVEPKQAGKYRCEVSTESPSFITVMKSGYMHVVRLPEGNVTVHMEKPRYAQGDTLRGNCTAPPANPPANITWTVNGLPVNASHVKSIRSGIARDNRTISVARLEFELAADSFSNGRLHVTCHADVFHLYKQQTTVVLEEERPRLASVLGTRESSHSRSTSSSAGHWCTALALVVMLIGSTR